MNSNPSASRRLLPILALVGGLCSCAIAQTGAIEQAYKAYQRADHVTALRALSDAETYRELSIPRHAEVLLLQGRCLEDPGCREEAAALYEYLIKTYPDKEFAARAQARPDKLRPAP